MPATPAKLAGVYMTVAAPPVGRCAAARRAACEEQRRLPLIALLAGAGATGAPNRGLAGVY